LNEGLFVPNLVVGAAYGRLIGQIATQWFPDTIPGFFMTKLLLLMNVIEFSLTYLSFSFFS
jgi:H+/Cl- antiporter ClcA